MKNRHYPTLLLGAALLLSLLNTPISAQVVGTCEPGQARADLDVGNVRAPLFNGGNLFYSPDVGSLGYEIPKDSGISAAFAAQLWLGGIVQGELRTASATFVDQEFWPGPLDPSGTPPVDCAVYDRMFSVYRSDVEHYLATGEATDDLLEWPHDLGAPVLDGDGDPDNYDLEGGDQPAIWGDQTVWWVMNDLGNEHVRSEGTPLGIEVQVTAFAVDRPGQAPGDATFYIYRLLNKGSLPMDSMFAGFWWDTDIGAGGDEYAGTDTTRMLAYAYNAESDSDYGDRPPALGVKLLVGAIADDNGHDDDGDGDVDEDGERVGMTSSGYALNGAAPPRNDPRLSPEYYYVMNGRWYDGTPITEGGTGLESGGPETKFVFPGDAVTGQFWSEQNVDGNGGNGSPGNKRGIISAGPFTIPPHGEQETVFSIVFGQGADNLDSITWMRAAADAIQQAFDDGEFAPQYILTDTEQTPEGAESILISGVSPNPVTDRATIRFILPSAMSVRLVVIDMLGREVAVLTEGELGRGEHEASLSADTLRPGVYVVRIDAGPTSTAIKFVRQ